jgi:hypothetical protein
MMVMMVVAMMSGVATMPAVSQADGIFGMA